MEPQVGHEENCLFPDLYMNHRKKRSKKFLAYFHKKG